MAEAKIESPTGRSAAVTFIFVTMLLDWLVIGMASPVFPNLIVNFTGGQVDRASAILGGFATAFALVQLFASPVLGILSDRFGRRPIILLSNLGAAVDFAILAFAPNLWWLFAGRILSGVTAGSATCAAAYIADVTVPERRAAAYGMAGAAFGLGFALGPAAGGLLAGFGLRVPFFAAGILMLVSAAYGFFVLPESLPRERRRREIDWKRANPLGSLQLVRRHRELFRLVCSLFCSNLAVQSFSVFVLYTIYRFTWSARANGLALGIFGALSVASAMVVGKLVARFGARAIVVTGFGLGTAGFLIYAFALTGQTFLLALPLTGLWAMAGAPIQSAMSRHVSASEQGELQGAIGSMRSIATVVGPPFFTLLFALVSARGEYPLVGAPWFCGAALLVAAAILGASALNDDRGQPAAAHDSGGDAAEEPALQATPRVGSDDDDVGAPRAGRSEHFRDRIAFHDKRLGFDAG
jgi:DHA1 family tetracycline resistance protein-like MFS transporter